MGLFKEKLKNFYNKIVGEQASAEYIARGWAIGMFWGCICPFGLQLLCSIPSSFLLKGSKIGATLGTFITNHFTIFVIYPLQCYVGCLLIGRPVGYADIKSAMSKVISEQSYDALMGTGVDLAIGFFVGGALLAAIMTPITYFGVKHMVNSYRRRHQAQ